MNLIDKNGNKEGIPTRDKLYNFDQENFGNKLNEKAYISNKKECISYQYKIIIN